MTAGIKRYKLIIKKKRKKHDKIILLAKSKLNSIRGLISKTLTGSVISHDEFVLINIVVKEYNEMKDKIKFLKTWLSFELSPRSWRTKPCDRKVFDRTWKFIKDFSLFIRQSYRIAWSVQKIQKVKIQKLQGKKTEE